MNDQPANNADQPVVLFDGVCNLCNASVNFIIDRDRRGVFRFASLQSEVGQNLLRRFQMPTGELSTIVLVDADRHYVRSSAALRIARRLRFPWPVFYLLIMVPRPLRDLAYNFVARHRYRWFGKTESCRIPTPESRARFLDADQAEAVSR